MPVSGIAGATANVQIPIAIKEGTPSEERNESQVQKAAEQMKADLAQNLSSANGIGALINVKA